MPNKADKVVDKVVWIGTNTSQLQYFIGTVDSQSGSVHASKAFPEPPPLSNVPTTKVRTVMTDSIQEICARTGYKRKQKVQMPSRRRTVFES